MFRNLVRSFRLWLTPAALILASVAPADAQEVFGGWGSCGLDCGTCPVGCQTHHCPPALQHCQEGAPKIRVKCGCPKPICNPCTQPNWGYYETCWRPWPFEPNYHHCIELPPAATIALTGPQNPNYPYYGPNGQGGYPNQGVAPNPGRVAPLPVEPSMPPVTAPPIPTTPVMPRMGAGPQNTLPMQPMPPLPPQPNTPMPQPVPGGGIDSLPVPRPGGGDRFDGARYDGTRYDGARPLPNPGGAF